MHAKTNMIRWLLVLPSVFAGWFVALFVGLLLLSVADAFCPPELMVSGMCMASWSASVKDGILIFGASLSAMLVLLLPVFVAPEKRASIAKAVFGGGVLFALYALYETSAWSAFIGAVLVGTLTFFFILRLLRGSERA